MSSNDQRKLSDHAPSSPRIPSTAREVEHVQSTLSACFEAIQSRHEGQDVERLQTGFAEFDALTAGLRAEELIVVGGRPSSGKSAFTMNLCVNLAIRSKKPVAIFTMEMTRARLTDRLLASLSQVAPYRLHGGQLTEEEWVRLNSAIRQLRDAPLYIDDTAALAPETLGAKVAKLKTHQQITLVVVDYLQLMQVPGWPESEAAQLAEISRSLKALAKEQKITIIAVSQMNRFAEHRQDKTPQLSDLRGAGSLEDDADIVVLLQRTGYHRDSDLLEAAVRKQRHGPTGSFGIRLSGEFMCMEEAELSQAQGQGSGEISRRAAYSTKFQRTGRLQP